MSRRIKLPAQAGDPGQYLPLLAVHHADRARRRKKPLSWSEALAAAPWGPALPSAWERPFREAYAKRLVEIGSATVAAPRGTTSGAPGKNLLDRRTLRQSAKEFADQDRRAKEAGVPWGTWVRRKLAT